MGFNIGGFAQGLQGGIGTGMALRRGRQDERLRDVLARQLETQEMADQEALGALGGQFSEEGLDDPFMFRMVDWFRNRKGGQRKALASQAQVQPGVPADTGMGMGPDQGLYADGGMPKRSALRGYGEGGMVDEDDPRKGTRRSPTSPEGKRAAERAQARARPAPTTSTQTVEGDPSKYKPARPGQTGNAPRSATGRMPKYEGVGVDKAGGVKPDDSAWEKTKGRTSGALKAGTAGYLAGAAATGAAEGYDTSTDEMYDQLALSKQGDPNETYNADNPLAFLASPEFWKDAGVRTVGVMGSVGRAILPDSWTRSRDELAGREAPQPQMAAAPAPAPAPAAPPAGGATSAISRARSAPAAAPSGSTMGPPQPQVDFSSVSPQEIPDFKVDDWSKHRQLAVRQLVARGIPLGDAFERVDQQVTAMQQRGFTNFAQQGLALMEAGNQRAAMSAFRAAFQYFPSGTDVKFGMQNGQIIGIGVDEKTGETVGAPMLLDAERVSAMIDNFNTPGAWQAWAKDRRDFQQKMREYEEVTKPQSEGLTSAALTQADAAQARSQADLIYARTGGGSGASGYMTHERDAMRQLSGAFMNIEGVEGDPMVARSLASASMQIWQRFGGEQPWPTIVEAVSRAAQIQDPQQRAAMFARLGVADPMSVGAGPPQ